MRCWVWVSMCVSLLARTRNYVTGESSSCFLYFFLSLFSFTTTTTTTSQYMRSMSWARSPCSNVYTIADIFSVVCSPVTFSISGKELSFLPNKWCTMFFFLFSLDISPFNCWNYNLCIVWNALKWSWSPFRKFQMEISSKQNSLSRLWLPVSSLPSIIVYH